MISLLAYSNNAGELHSVKEQVCDLAAYLSEEKWETSCFSSLEQLMAFLKSQPLVNLACYDVTERESRDYLSTVRKKYRDTLLMLIADSTLSPMEYVKPDILAASLILRPYSQEDLRGKLKDLICEYLSRMQDGEDAFIVETREGKTRIPYEQIYYLEARDKKIYVRLRDRELSFYDTGVTAEYGDKLITLSTCEYSRNNSRLVVVAKRITEDGGADAAKTHAEATAEGERPN